MENRGERNSNLRFRNCAGLESSNSFSPQRQLFSCSDSFSRAATAFLAQRQLFSGSDSFSRPATAFLGQRQLFSASDSFSRPATAFLVLLNVLSELERSHASRKPE